MGSGVDDGKNQHGISYLPMEPLRFVQRQPSDLRSDKPEEVPAHGQEDQGAIEAQRETRTP